MSHPTPIATTAFAEPEGAGEPQTVLLIADADADREQAVELLEPGCTVLLATTGADGLERARLHQPDLILLDLLVPDMTGFEVLRRLKADARTAGTAVIFLTGQDHPEDEARCLLLGAADFLTKPLSAPVVAARVATQLRLAAYRRQVAEMEHLDGLTQVSNRRHFDETLAVECHRAQRAQSRLSVAMVDVDFFKQYNDRYGYARGDEALHAIAQALAAGMRRPADLVARHGGEEFALIMPDTAPANALKLANLLREAVAALQIPHAGSKAAYLTVSIGVATTEVGEDGVGEAVVKRADKNLFHAKAGGRNTVVGEAG
ncbi:MAG: diguanylate cyclase [Pseudomonadota bacterium]